MQILASVPKDPNSVALVADGVWSSRSLTFTGNNTTVATALFGITGTIRVTGLWGVVTTVIGANHTASAWRLNDQTAQANITLNTGVDISGVAAGSIIVKKGLAGAASVLINNSAGRVSEPTTLETMYFSPFVVTKKTGAVTNIEYVYATTDQPTSGAIQFYLTWMPMSDDANVSITV